MPAYMKIEDLQNYSEISLRREFMAISSLALLIVPWALIGFALYALNVHFMNMDMLIFSISILAVSLPKLFQLLWPEDKRQTTQAPTTIEKRSLTNDLSSI
jgi:hypothetical protein